MLAAQCDDRANGDPRRFHVDQKEADAFLLLRILVGADEEESPVGMLRQRRPGLLPVDDIVVAVAHGRRAQDGKIRERKSVVTGKRVSDRVDLVCGGELTTKKQYKK